MRPNKSNILSAHAGTSSMVNFPIPSLSMAGLNLNGNFENNEEEEEGDGLILMNAVDKKNLSSEQNI